jgi:hypothetical protein
MRDPGLHLRYPRRHEVCRSAGPLSSRLALLDGQLARRRGADDDVERLAEKPSPCVFHHVLVLERLIHVLLRRPEYNCSHVQCVCRRAGVVAPVAVDRSPGAESRDRRDGFDEEAITLAQFGLDVALHGEGSVAFVLLRDLIDVVEVEGRLEILRVRKDAAESHDAPRFFGISWDQPFHGANKFASWLYHFELGEEGSCVPGSAHLFIDEYWRFSTEIVISLVAHKMLCHKNE